jgi:hypothetical protein
MAGNLVKPSEWRERGYGSRFPANESLRNRFTFISFGKPSFYLPAFEISRSCRSASGQDNIATSLSAAHFAELHTMLVRSYGARDTKISELFCLYLLPCLAVKIGNVFMVTYGKIEKDPMKCFYGNLWEYQERSHALFCTVADVGCKTYVALILKLDFIFKTVCFIKGTVA